MKHSSTTPPPMGGSRWGAVLLVLLLLSSCGGKRGHLQVEVQLENLDQVDLYLYSSDGAIPQIDTIHLEKGRGSLDCLLTDSATLHLVYPNYTELVFWASDGDAVSITGDAQNLAVVNVDGNRENKLYSKFRQQTSTMSPDSVRMVAEDFIRQHPESPVSLHLLSSYFLDSKQGDKGLELCQFLLQESGSNPTQLQTIQRVLQSRQKLRIGATLPPFRLQPKGGKVITDRQFRGKWLIINFWASWIGTSSIVNFDAQRVLEQHNHQMHVLSYSLSVSQEAERAFSSRVDTLSWTDYCDQQGWNSPLVQQYGINNLPTTLLVNPQGRIVAMGCNFGRDIQPEIDKIK